MRHMIECVPNFSEGRDAARIDALVAAMSSVPQAWVLDRHSDADHNRTVVTLAGAPEAVAEAAVLGVGAAARLIDLTRHQGAHPRIGATDVLPFVPIEGVTMQDCVALAHRVGQEILERYQIPVYFYEAAALRPERAALEKIRKGQLETLRREAPLDPERSPDLGGPELHPTAGAIAIGARKFLIAYNINLDTPDAGIAAEIARAIRSSSGGLPALKALGIALPSRGISQVSMNLTDFEQTSLQQVYAAVRDGARRRGCAIAGSEIVGLAPRKAIDPSAEYFRALDGFPQAQILEDRLAAAMDQLVDEQGLRHYSALTGGART
jgi:glutamate formiminotransferase